MKFLQIKNLWLLYFCRYDEILNEKDGLKLKFLFNSGKYSLLW